MGKTKQMVNFLDNLSSNLFGRERSQAIAQGVCVVCGKPATKFTDALSQREYKISGYCHECQNVTFGE